ncbi:MAG: N-acetyltransferase [Rhodobacteraceae bacterium]|nr:N-acetyltransferase [Paracoccaceae bacterium]
MTTLSPILPSDHESVERLYDLAFGPGRYDLSSYRLRESLPDIASLALKSVDGDGGLCGAIRFWPIRIGDCDGMQLLLGPIAVHPTRQGEGIGCALITEGIDRARRADYRAIVLVGDEPYYSRFGFRKAPSVTMPAPTNPERTLMLDFAATGTQPLIGPVRQWRGTHSV